MPLADGKYGDIRLLTVVPSDVVLLFLSVKCHKYERERRQLEFLVT